VVRPYASFWKDDHTIPKKRRKPEEIVTKLRQVNVLVAEGRSVTEAVRSAFRATTGVRPDQR